MKKVHFLSRNGEICDIILITTRELAEALNGHSVAFAYHSGKIKNENVTYNDTREVFERDGVTSYTGDLRTLFEIRNSKEANELLLSSFNEKRPVDEALVREFQRVLTQNTYDTRRWQLGERSGEYKRHDYVTGKNEIGAAPKDVYEEMAELLAELDGIMPEEKSATVERLLRLRKNAVEHKYKTGYPYLDASHLQFYTEQEINNYEFPDMSMYGLVYDRIIKNGYNNLIAMEYFGRKITYSAFLDSLADYSSAFLNIGIQPGEIVSVCSSILRHSLHTSRGLHGCVHLLSGKRKNAHAATCGLTARELPAGRSPSL